MSWKTDALDHARQDSPKESVGLLLNVKGKKRYFPCRNIHTLGEQCFVLDPISYVEAEKVGQIIAIIHSHPSTHPTPSQSDLISCESSKLPWHIVNPITEEWGYCEPTGYKAPLKGRSWCWGVSDCFTLFRDYYRDELGIVVKDYERPLTAEEFIDEPLFERYAEEAGFRLLSPSEKLQNGDALLMSIASRGLNHVAIFIDGDVLHHMTDRLSCQEPYSEWLLKCTGGRYRYAQNG
jgi:proteasome lid subunit RPN8/RPN11